MQLIQASHSQTGLLGLLTFERRNWLALVIMGFVSGYGVGNGHTTTGAVEHISDQLGQTEHKAAVVETEAQCEHRRADKATAVAGNAILSANVDNVPTPKFKDLPTDNCPHIAAK